MIEIGDKVVFNGEDPNSSETVIGTITKLDGDFVYVLFEDETDELLVRINDLTIV